MNTYVMSDIHGQSEAYFEVLEQIHFQQWTEEEHLYILGDVIDRGVHSIKILQHIMEHQDKITLLMGNHEQMMILSLPNTRIENFQSDTCQLWKASGGETTCTELVLLDMDERGKILDFVRNLPTHKVISVNNQSYHLVHAMPDGAKSQKSTHQMTKEDKMLWGFFKSYPNKKEIAVFGHRCTAFYDPDFRDKTQLPEHFSIYQQDNFISIDCGCAYENKLSRLGCLRLEDGAEFYGKLPVYVDDVWW